MAPSDRKLSNRLIGAALVILLISYLMQLNAIRADSPWFRTAGVVLLVFSTVVFVVALGVRYVGKHCLSPIVTELAL